MARLTRPLLLCGAVLLAAACTRVVDGTAVPAFGGAPQGVQGVDVDTILLDQSRMRAITGAGEHLTIIPSMDGSSPVDIDALADTTPRECRFIYAETATFGPDVEEFHKTTFQDPPDGALISEGAAAYRDVDTARRAFDTLVATVGHCAAGSAGQPLSATGRPTPTRCTCGRAAAAATIGSVGGHVEVTFCGFPQSVSDIVMTNIAANVPGSSERRRASAREGAGDGGAAEHLVTVGVGAVQHQRLAAAPRRAAGHATALPARRRPIRLPRRRFHRAPAPGPRTRPGPTARVPR